MNAKQLTPFANLFPRIPLSLSSSPLRDDEHFYDTIYLFYPCVTWWLTVDSITGVEYKMQDGRGV